VVVFTESRLIKADVIADEAADQASDLRVVSVARSRIQQIEVLGGTDVFASTWSGRLGARVWLSGYPDDAIEICSTNSTREAAQALDAFLPDLIRDLDAAGR
jgi:hypothetical protein